ncbi:23S ribosomal RNA methyltransferase Erm [Leucobacter sp. GX24907]
MSRSSHSSRSSHGGRHELGQNFLTHAPTVSRIVELVARTDGAILEIGAGDGALTRRLVSLERPLTAIDIDEHCVERLARVLPGASIEHADAMRYPLLQPVVVGNVPFHLTTPILRRMLARGSWTHAVLLTQWEVARKRSGVGGATMMTAQTSPWFAFSLHGRVPAWGFTPRPSVDGGILRIARRERPLLPLDQREGYERFVRAVFTGKGGRIARVLQQASRVERGVVMSTMRQTGVAPHALPRDLRPEQWAGLWQGLRGSVR